MKKTTYLLVLLVISFFAFPKFSLALGQMTEPIVINNALRGESIQQELIAVNSDKTETEVKYSAEGDIKDWANFYLPGDLETPVDTFILPASGNQRVIAIINVPDDVENGVYKGKFSVSNIPSTNIKEGESGSNVTQKIDRQISITISDQEEIDIANTSVIPNKFDLNVDEPLSIRVIYDNQGNIRIAPQLRIKITKDDKTFQDLIYPYPEDEKEVGANSQHEINPITVQTIGWEPGKYTVSLDFSHDDETLLEKDFQFSIAEEGNDTMGVGTLLNNKYLGFGLFFGVLLILIIWQATKKLKN